MSAKTESSESEALPINLDIHTSLPTQVGVIDSRYDYANPINSIDDAKTIEFQITSHLNELIDPYNTYLYMETKLCWDKNQNLDTEADKDNPNKAKNRHSDVITANGLNYNLFKNVKIHLNDVQIASGDGMYAYRGDFETRLMWPKAVKEGMMGMTGFDEESIAFEHASKGEINFLGKGEQTTAFNRRAKLSAGSKTMYSIGRIHSEIFDQSKYLPPRSKLYVAFDRQDFDEFSVLSEQKAMKYKIQILKCQLLVHYVTVDPDIVNEIILRTEKGFNYIIPLRRVSMRYYTKTSQTDFSKPNLFNEGEVLPRRIFITFVNSKAFKGEPEFDPFNYENLKVRRLALRIGGVAKPYPELLLNRTDNDAIMPMLALYQATGSMFDDADLGIKTTNYFNRNNFFGLDLTSYGSKPGECYELPNTKSCDLEVTLEKTPPQATYTMIVYAEYDSELEIDKYRNVKKKNFGTAE